jgi:hypothetical protein
MTTTVSHDCFTLPRQRSKPDREARRVETRARRAALDAQHNCARLVLPWSCVVILSLGGRRQTCRMKE